MAGHSEACLTILRALKPGPKEAALFATDEASGENALHCACIEGHTNCVAAILSEVKLSTSTAFILRGGTLLVRESGRGVF